MFGLNGYNGMINSIIMSSSICLYIFSFFCSQERDNVSKNEKSILSILGNKTLEIYILHIYFVPMLYPIGEFFLSISSWTTCITMQIVYSLLVSVVAILISLLLANIFSSNKYFKLMLFGK